MEAEIDFKLGLRFVGAQFICGNQGVTISSCTVTGHMSERWKRSGAAPQMRRLFLCNEPRSYLMTYINISLSHSHYDQGLQSDLQKET